MNRIDATMLSPDDPRLTAFALGELEGEDFAIVAAAVAAHPDLQDLVQDIRRAADDLTAALASEPLPEVEPLVLTARLNGQALKQDLVAFPRDRAAGPVAMHGKRPAPAIARAPSYSERTAASRRRHEPRLSYFWVMTLSAACFMLVVFLSERRFTAEAEAAAAQAARLAATDRARAAAAAAAAAQLGFLELDLSEREYARATLPTRPVEVDADYLAAERRPTSSFPIDVATTSYGDVVRAIAARQLPPPGTVRIEELLNTFAYDYPEPSDDADSPFAAALEAADAPWAPGHRLVRIGLKGRTGADRSHAIARNVSIQVQFNPETVQSYRLIGYEKSPLVAQETLSAGRVDAAEVHAGHTVTALYEVIPVAGDVAPESLADENAATESDAVTRLLTVRIAYTRPDGVAARPVEFPLDDRGATFGDASGDFKFAAAVAGFGMMLRQPGSNESLTFGSIIAWAEQGVAQDHTGRRKQFVGLVRDASEFLQ